MALTKEKKVEVVVEIGQLLEDSRLTVMARYTGTSVKSMQQLRHDAASGGTQVRVVKNRLVKKALAKSQKFSGVDTSVLQGQLIYAFNATDEVAPAQALAVFAKNEPQLEFVGAFTHEGQLILADDVKALAALPSKEQLRAMLVGTIAAPINGFVGVLSGNVRSVLNVLSARSEQLS